MGIASDAQKTQQTEAGAVGTAEFRGGCGTEESFTASGACRYQTAPLAASSPLLAAGAENSMVLPSMALKRRSGSYWLGFGQPSLLKEVMLLQRAPISQQRQSGAAQREQ